MKKTKGEKLIKKLNKVKDKIRKAYAIGTKVRYVGKYGEKGKTYTIKNHDNQNIQNVILLMNQEATYISISDLEIVK